MLPVLAISHTMIAVDHTSFTAIWSQPVTALQIKDWDGQWRYVRHFDNALVSSLSIRIPCHTLNLQLRS
jgi:hypothetical protein